MRLPGRRDRSDELSWLALPHLLVDFGRLARKRSLIPGLLSGSAAVLELAGVGLFTPILGRLLRQALAVPGVPLPPPRVLQWLPLPEEPLWLLLLVVLAFLGRGLLLALDWHVTAQTAARVTHEMREEVLGSLLAARYTHLADQSPGRMAHAVTAEAERVGDGYQLAHRITLGLLQVALYGALAVALAWQLGLMVVAAALVWARLARASVRGLESHGAEAVQTVRALAGETADVLASMKPVKAMAGEAWLERRLLARILEVTRLSRLIERQRTFTRMTMEAAQVCAVVALVYVGVAWWRYPPEVLLVSLALVVKAMSRLASLQLDVSELLRYRGILQHLREIVASARLVAEAEGGEAPPPLDRGIELRDVSLVLGGRVVLSAASLSLPPRGLVCVTGPSGAGKTSFLDLVAGLLQPSAGEIRVDGVALARIDARAWRRGLGYVSQSALLLRDSLFSNVTLGDPALGPEAVRSALETSGAAAFVDERLDGLTGDAGEQGNRLSGGERQRIALARALVRNPRLLLLDEVTAGLAPSTEEALVQVICGIARERLVLVATHSEAVIQRADVVVSVAGGSMRTLSAR